MTPRTAAGFVRMKTGGLQLLVAGQKESELYMIRIGEERYEIPEAVIFGG